jgi:predicted nucleic-acid-binding Zn-ribbon protein
VSNVIACIACASRASRASRMRVAGGLYEVLVEVLENRYKFEDFHWNSLYG